MTTEADNIIGHYQRHAQAWAVARGDRLIEKAWFDRFLAPLSRGAAILDLGCGSGDPVARYLVSVGCVLTGIDSSPGLLAMCAEKFPAHTWLEADMRRLALGRLFDGILAWDSFFHLSHDDQRRMFPIFRAHSAPGGCLMFTSGTAHGVAIGEFRGEPLYHASLDPAEYRALLNANDFEVREYVEQDPSCGGRTIWLAGRIR